MAMDNAVREMLAELVTRYGHELAGEPKRCRALLADRCGGDRFRAEQSVIWYALDTGVARDLAVGQGNVSAPDAEAYRQRLEDDWGADPAAAAWSVATWAVALGRGVAGTPPAKPAPSPPAEPRSTAAPSVPSGKAPADLLVVAKAVYAPQAGLAAGSKEAQEAQRAAVAKLGLPLEVTSAKTGIAFRLIPAGTFSMGSPPGEKKRRSDETLHEVTLSKAFYCGKYPVTQGQWQAVMDTNPSHFAAAGSEAPVEQVSWEDCQGFLAKLCQREGVAAGTYRLLTEAEWEYACRAGTSTPFCHGDSVSSNQANFDGNYPYGGAAKGEYRQKTTPVGQFKSNGWGLYDMHGNVYEWCNDWYGDYPSGTATDPAGPGSGSGRVGRGGSWYNSARYCRAANRRRGEPGFRLSNLGFRLARTGS